MIKYDERRRHVRVWRARLRVAEFRLASFATGAFCKNISAGGMLVCSVRPYKGNDLLDFELVMPGWREYCINKGAVPAEFASDTYRGLCRVMRVETRDDGTYNIGMEFMGDAAGRRELLNKFILRHIPGIEH